MNERKDSVMSMLHEAWNAGKAAGFRTGWDYGYHYARCDTLVQQELRAEKRLFDMKVLYVKADGQPYASLDEGIMDGLATVVREWHAIGPEAAVADTAVALRPDLVLVLDAAGRPFPIEQVKRIRAAGIKTAVWFPDDPYHSDLTMTLAPHYDYVFTLELSIVPHYRAVGAMRAHYLPFAVSPRKIRPQRVDTSYHYDICFIGTAFWNRAAFFDQIAEYLRTKRVFINGWFWDRMTKYPMLANKIHGFWLPPEEATHYYSGAKVVINLHRSADDETHNTNSRRLPAASVNPRLFEIAASGTLQLTDAREQMAAMYVPGSELVTFGSPQELIDRIDYYLAHEDERRVIAWNALKRTLRDHTYRKRLASLFSITNPDRAL